MRYKITRTAAYMASQENQSPELKHYGVKGMKWGEKKFGKGPGLDDRYRNDEELARAARAAQPTRPQINTQQKLSQLLGSAQSKVSGSSAAAKAISKPKAKPKVSDALLERVFGKTKEVNKINTNPHYPNKQTRTTATVKVPGLVTPVIDGGKKLVDTTVTGAKNIGSSIVKTATNAYNDAKKWVDGAIGTIGSTAVKVGDTAKSAYNDAKKWVDGLFSRTESVERGGLGAAQVYKKGGIEKAYDSAKAGITKTATQVGDAAKTAYGDAKKWVDGLFSKTESVERGGLGAAKVYKKGGIEKAYDSAKAGITKTATQVGDAAKTAYGDAKKWVDGALKTVGGAADDVGKTVTKTAQQAVRSGRIAVDNLLTGHKKHPTHESATILNKKQGPRIDEGKLHNEVFNPAKKSGGAIDRYEQTRTKTGIPSYLTPAEALRWNKEYSQRSLAENKDILGTMMGVKKQAKPSFGHFPSGADARKYLQGQGVINYQEAVKTLSKDPTNKSALEEMSFFRNTIEKRKAADAKKKK